MDWTKIKSEGIPVAIGFVGGGLILAFLKYKFGIEIGDPVTVDDVDNPNDDDTNPEQEN